MKKETVWIIDRDWKGNFKVIEVSKFEADKINIKQHKTKKEAENALSNIWIDQPYS